MVFDLQVQARRHRVRAGLAAAGRILQDRRHDRRVDGQGADETAPQARRIPHQTRMAAFSGDDRGRGDERPAGDRHLLRRLLRVGRQLLLERGRQMGVQLQRGGAQARLRGRRQVRDHRRRAGRRHQQDTQFAAHHRRRAEGRRRARREARGADVAAGRADRDAPGQRLRRPLYAACAVPAQARRRDRGHR